MARFLCTIEKFLREELKNILVVQVHLGGQRNPQAMFFNLKKIRENWKEKKHWSTQGGGGGVSGQSLLV